MVTLVKSVEFSEWSTKIYSRVTFKNTEFFINNEQNLKFQMPFLEK